MFGFFFQAEDGIRYLVRSRWLGDVYKRQDSQERDDPALAFERLRGEVSLLRHAVEALTTARELSLIHI